MTLFQAGRRGGLLLARFSGACAEFGIWPAVRLYGWQLRDGTERSIWCPALQRPVHFRDRGDYLVLAHLFGENYSFRGNLAAIRSVIDLGANIGVETLRLAGIFAGSKVVAVEPDEQNFRMLERNVAGDQRIRPVCAGAWGESCRVSVRRKNVSHEDICVAQDNSGEIPGMTIPDLMKLGGFDEIGLLKVDIEGAEVSVFGPTAIQWIARLRVLVWELNDHEAPFALQSLVNAMSQAGVRFNFHLLGETIFGIRSDVDLAVV